MKIYEAQCLRNFDFWGAARNNAELFTERQLDLIEDYLEDIYPQGLTEMALNEMFEYDHIRFIGYLREIDGWQDKYANFHDEDLPGDMWNWVEFLIPDCLIYAFCYMDTSGLEENDTKAFEEFCRKWEDKIVGSFDEYFFPEDGNEPEFVYRDDVFGTGCDAYRFLVKLKKAA